LTVRQNVDVLLLQWMNRDTCLDAQ
jgi:hypothetical protein